MVDASSIDYDSGGALPYKKKAKKIDRSRCNHIFLGTKESTIYSYVDKSGVTWESQTIYYRCKLCRKLKSEHHMKRIPNGK